MSHWFACEIEELVRPRGATQPTVRRLDRGFARSEGNITRGFSIEAATAPFDETLNRLADRLARPPVPELPEIPTHVASRVLTRASAVSTGGAIHSSSTQLIALTADGMSIVSTPESLSTDLSTLETLYRREPLERVEPGSLPIAWQNGSAAVLFHEAVGHPAERGLFSTTAPQWLRIEDSPASGELVRMELDDTGAVVTTQALSDRARPAALRRWSHRDVPARRLTNLIVRGLETGLAPIPATRIDVLLVAEGYWDPTNDAVGVRIVAADLVDGPHRLPIEPFVYTTTRRVLFPMITGWFGELTRHPGVLCSDEGVALPVGSAAVGLVTEGR